MSGKLVVVRDGTLHLSDGDANRLGLLAGAEYLIQETPEGLHLRRTDPPLTRVYIEPTNGCNLSCRTCVRNSWSEPSGVIDMDVYRRLLADLSGVPSLRKVSFWGFGEPLLHPGIIEMVAMAKGLGVETQMITNALLLDAEKARGLVAAGLDSLVVSVDGASAEAYTDVRSGADLDLVKHNAGLLRDAREEQHRGNPEIGLEFVVMRRNVGELRHLRELARSLGASFIVLTNVLPYTEELMDEILYGSVASSYFSLFRSKWSPEISVPRMDSYRRVLDPLISLLNCSESVGRSVSGFRETGAYCRFVNEGSAVVAWDGEVSPCVALMHSYPCYILGRRKEIRRYSLGNVGKESIVSIWGREEFKKFRGVVKAFDFSPCSDCGGCHFAETNEEDCFGNTFPVCGDCLWAKGIIQCP